MSNSGFVGIYANGRPVTPRPSGHCEDPDDDGEATSYHRHQLPQYTLPDEGNQSMASRNSESTMNDNMGPRVDGNGPRRTESQVDGSFRSILKRLAIVEKLVGKRNKEPLGEVTDALSSIEAKRLQLEKLERDLSQRYQQNIDQMSQAAASIGTWHGQMRDEVNRNCDERNSKLHKAVEQIFERLQPLEHANARPAIEDHRQRIELLETSAKSSVDSKHFSDFAADYVARVRGLEETVRNNEYRKDERFEQYAQCLDTLEQAVQNSSSSGKKYDERIDALHEAIQESNSSAIYRYDNAEKECQDRYGDLKSIADRAEAECRERCENLKSSTDNVERDCQDRHGKLKDSADKAEKDCRSRYRDLKSLGDKTEEKLQGRYGYLRSIADQIETRLSKVEGSGANKKTEEHCQAAVRKSESAVKTVNSLSSRMNRFEEQSNAFRNDLDQLSAQTSQHQKDSVARDTSHSSRMDRFDESISRLRSDFDILSAGVSQNAEENIVRDNGLSAQSSRIEQLIDENAALRKDLDLVGANASKREKDEVNRVISQSSCMNQYSERLGALRSDHERLVATASETERDSRSRDTILESSIERLETRLTEYQQRVESNRPTATPPHASCDHSKVWETKFATLSRRVEEYDKAVHRRCDFLSGGAQLGRHVDAAESRIGRENEPVQVATQLRELIKKGSGLSKALGQRIRRLEDGSSYRAESAKAADGQATELSEDLRRRLDTVELRVETSMIHQNVNKLDQVALQTRLKEVESSLDQTPAGEDATESVVRRLTKLEDGISVFSLEQRVEAIMRPSLTNLMAMVDRTAALEIESQSASSNIQQQLEATCARIDDLKEDSIAMATDRRFESLTEALTKLRQDTAAGADSKQRIESLSVTLTKMDETVTRMDLTTAKDAQHKEELLARTSQLEKDMKSAQVAHGVRGQVIDDLIKRADVVDQKQETTGKLAQDVTSFSVKYNYLKEQFVELRDDLEKARAFIGEVDEKSQKEAQDVRVFIERVDEKSQEDDRKVLYRLQLYDQEHKLRLESFKDGMVRLRDEMHALRPSDCTGPPKRPAGVADDILSLHQRLNLEAEDLDEQARQQLISLARLIVGERLLGAAAGPPNAEEIEGALQDESIASTPNSGPRGISDANEDSACAGGTRQLGASASSGRAGAKRRCHSESGNDEEISTQDTTAGTSRDQAVVGGERKKRKSRLQSELEVNGKSSMLTGR